MRQEDEVHIYGLFDPRTEECRYVGSTSQPKKRFSHHVISARSLKTAKAAWIRELQRDRMKPIFRTLAIVSRNDRYVSERRWMARLFESGNRLTNADRYWRLTHLRVQVAPKKTGPALSQAPR